MSECRDGDRVTIGGMISQIKKLRTKKGDPMVFATLEDLQGSVELVIFADTLEEAGEAVQQDAVVLIKGKIDHKDASRTCVVVSSVDRFEPDRTGDGWRQRRKQRGSWFPNRFRSDLDAAAVQIDRDR